jgi:EmrB/QacA subfamily drug resistance transporter
MNQPDTRPAFAVILAAGFMTLLDVSIVNVALPSIQTSLGADPSHLQWLVAGYSLAFGLILVPAGRFGDVFGRRRVFLAGMALFTVASVACGLVTSAAALVVARLVQGLSAAIINPQVIGFIQQLYTGPRRARAFGMFGAAIGVSTAIGPVLGGVLIALFGQHDGWRAVFLVNLPVGLIVLPMAAKYLPEAPPHAREPLNLDLMGLLLIGATVLAVMWPFVAPADHGLAEHRWWALAVAAIGFGALLSWELRLDGRGGAAILPRRLLRNPGFMFGAAMGTAFFAGFTAIFIIVTLYLQQGLKWTPWQAGALQLPFAVASAISAAKSGKGVVRWGRWYVVGALAITVAGLIGVDLAVGFAPESMAPWLMVGFLTIAGYGNGSVISPNQALTLADVSVAESGTAGGVLQTTQRVGASIGLAIVTAVYFSSVAHGHAQALSLALRVSILTIGLALVAATMDAMRRRGRNDYRPDIGGNR